MTKSHWIILNSAVIIDTILIIMIIIAMFINAFTDEYWYVGEHDSHCEKVYGKDKSCHCYERLISNSKEKETTWNQ